LNTGLLAPAVNALLSDARERERNKMANKNNINFVFIFFNLDKLTFSLENRFDGVLPHGEVKMLNDLLVEK